MKKNHRPRAATLTPPRRRKAFTLIEIVIVIALIGGLMAVLMGNFSDTFATGQENTESIKIKSKIGGALQIYRAHVGTFPTDEEGGLGALISPPEGSAARWKGPYLKQEELLDSWRQPYNYRCPGANNPRSFDLWSNGANRINENGGGDDIANWK
ncbi:MAG: type II secretion system protein GspG [Puniceicoccales bacterium]|nr:type II secretion system protein GspG [Puniceicoccales bacterium]